jgi:tryptophanyl-tRNA synthetase
MCGMCKKRAAEQMDKLLINLQEKRKTAAGKMKDYLK